jgi:hypothetical protein
VRNKACLVAQGFSQVKGLDFGETFAPVTCLEAVRILLAFAAFKGFKVYQRSRLWGNLCPQVLRTPNIIIECTSFQRLGMLGLRYFC